MVGIYRFSGVRPEKPVAKAIAAVPYDVVTTNEAREIIAKNNLSFLRVSRPDAELHGIPHSDDRIYQRAHQNFIALMKGGLMHRDRLAGMYLYRIQQRSDTFLGLCCCLDVEDYRNNHIRRHEQTRYDKEEDRTRHIEAVGAHSGPVVILYRNSEEISSFIESLAAAQEDPDGEVRTEQGAVHQIFRITGPRELGWLEQFFLTVRSLYIADGHHRAKAAVNVADRRIAAGGSAEGEISRFMAVMFAHDRVKIHGYSRLLTDLGSYTEDMFIESLRACFDVREYGAMDASGYNIPPKILSPEKYHVMHLYLQGKWYECTRLVDPRATPLEAFDVAVLQEMVLEPMLGITDPRGDARLQYLGGARPVADLEKLVNSGEYKLAFAMQPVRVETVLSIADAGGVMPPKSTWFEPKLLSGLVVHTFD